MPSIIDGRRWLQARLQQLEAALAADPAEDRRKAIEAEMATVREELARHRRHVWRWLVWGGPTGGR